MAPLAPPPGYATAVHTNVLTSRIASATGMDPAFHRVVNSHILRFAIAMRVYVRIFGAVTVWWFERTNIYLKFRNLPWQMEEYYLLDTVNISDPGRTAPSNVSWNWLGNLTSVSQSM